MKLTTPQLPTDGLELGALGIAYNHLLRDLGLILNGKVGVDNLAAELLGPLNVSVPTDWITIGAPAASGAPAAPAFQNSFKAWADSDFSPPRFRKVGGDVELEGLWTLPNPLPSPGATLAVTLPAAYVPAFGIGPYADFTGAAWDVRASGAVNYRSGSLAGALSCPRVRFAAADRTPVAPNCWPHVLSTTSKVTPSTVVLLAPKDAGPGVSGGLPAGAATVPVLGPPDWEWQPGRGGGTGSVKVKNVPGLAPLRKYVLTFLALYG